MTTLTARLTTAFVVLLLLMAIGTVGFVVLEGFSTLDALYLTVSTLATVGYGDVAPVTPAGRLFAVALIIFGVGSVLYVFTVTAQLVLEGHLRDLLGRNAMQRRTDELSDHVIVCGYGRFGRVVADELCRNGAAVVVVDADPTREEALRALGTPYVIGSALEDAILERAGIRRARALVVATPSDPDNVFITLSAREKNPAIRIHARGETETGLRRLELAGATQVLSAYQSGGLRMAASILRPAVVDFLELSMPGHHAEVALEEMRVCEGCPLNGSTIGEIEQRQARVRVVALTREGEPIRIGPDPGTRVSTGDLLVVIGEREGLVRLAQAASAPNGG